MIPLRCCGLLLATLAATFPAPAKAAERPNVIVIMSDDQGAADAGCYGATDVQTPALDALAGRGVRFTQFYSAAPVCSPSRAALLTGRYPWQVGMAGNGSPPPSEEHDNSDAFGGRGLPVDGFTMARMFQQAGYATAHIGKWHLGIGVGTQPLQQGFDYSFGFLGGCIDNYSHFDYWGGPNRHDLWENGRRVRLPGKYFPDLLVDHAAEFIDDHGDRPFFMYFAINVPHYPYQGEPKWVDYYQQQGTPYPRNLYAAWLSTLDDRLAALMKHLDDRGLRENTVVVYQADNGYSTEQRAHNGGGSSGRYRGAKFSLFEGGTRLPAVLSWPGHLPEGEVRDQLTHGCDWLPTLAELCGVEVDASLPLDGESLVDVVRSADAPTPHDAVCWRFQDQWAVRQGRWKLMHQPRGYDKSPQPELVDGKWFLADIDADPSEATNLAADHPEVVEQLRRLYESRYATNRGD
ncbi:Arylsulfatase precursor [Posidoniimonas polymericola]|uniref:Arylsulfatase n=1 Tax=Posidoniimonas polymericola TaxID=2528002 RepID=A0A5C5YQ77_9BACT|nr:sulfatase-like hydrolase/transferase [Posidoniimonas polymericola]TWT77091.1 Arylsulfatase precursor [Posidoniimonas polymericola]